METSGIVKPAALQMMTRVLDEYCLEHQISGGIGREDTASMILALYRHGYQTADHLRDALDHNWATTH